MSTAAQNVPFLTICRFLDKVQKTTKNSKGKSKKELLEGIISFWRSVWKQYETKSGISMSQQQKGEDLFELLRLLLPRLDNTRKSYNMKEKTLARLYIKLSGLSQSSKQALELLAYKNTSFEPGKFRKGFDTLVYEMLRNRQNVKDGGLKIADINEMLTKMTAGREAFENVMRSLYNKCTALEHKFLVRLILKKNISVPTEAILNMIHDEAAELFKVNRCLHDLCLMMYDKDVTVEKPSIGLNKPFEFMLAERADLSCIEKDLSETGFIMEIKFDGERKQIHKNQSEFKFYSRGFNEYSSTYGTSADSANHLSSYLAKSIAPHVISCILDGEMMLYDNINKRYIPKGFNTDVKRMKTDQVAYQQCFIAYDCLYYNGRLLTDKPLRKRKDILHGFLEPIEGRVQISDCKTGSTKQDILDFMKQSIDQKEEGIMVKGRDSVYVPGSRTSGWYKLKPDYMDNVIADIDVLILGAYNSSAASAVPFSSFLVAVAEDPPEGKKPTIFYSFASVHSGWTNADMLELYEKTKDHWKPFDKGNPPSWLQLTPPAKNAPDKIIHPSKAIAITVRAAELIPNRGYYTGFTMRFPRVTAIRYDKPWYDCAKYSELQILKKRTDGKMVVGEMDQDTKTQLGKKTPPERKRKIPKKKLTAHLNHKISTKVASSGFLLGKEVCVLLDDGPRAKLERRIRRQGGKTVLCPVDTTDIIIGKAMTYRIQTLIKKDTFNIAKESWLAECLDRKKWRPPNPSDYIYMTTEYKDMMSDCFDRFGDPYRERLTIVALQNIFDDMNLNKDDLEAEWKNRMQKEFEIFGSELGKEAKKGFRGKKFFVSPSCNDVFTRCRISCNFGVIVEDKENADYIVCDDSEAGDSTVVSPGWIRKQSEAFRKKSEACQ